jgi:outer membrane protein assembly factor BamB/plastocyanin
MNEGPLFSKPVVRWGMGLLVVVGIIGGIAIYRGQEDEPAKERAQAREVQGWALPHADRDNSRTASSDIDASNVDELGVAWRQELSAIEVGVDVGIDSPPLLVDDVVYVQDAGSNVWAYDLRSGDELWRRKLRTPAVGPNGIAYENGRIYGATPTDAFALDADNGGVDWRTRLFEGPVGPRRASLGISMAPMVADGRVLFGDSRAQGGGEVISLDAETGEEQWRVANPVESARPTARVGGVLGTPLVDDEDVVHVGVGGAEGTGVEVPQPGSLRAFDGSTGEPDWVFEPELDEPTAVDLHLAPAAVELEEDDAIVIGGTDGIVRAIATDDAVQLWETRIGDDDRLFVLEQYAVDGDTIYVAANVGEDGVDAERAGTMLVALDAETGDPRWQVEFGLGEVGAFTATNDLLLMATSSGMVHALSSEDGQPVTSIELDAMDPTSVSVVGEHVVVGATAQAEPGSDVGARPVVIVLQLGADAELEPEQSADVADEPDEVSDKPATNPVPPPVVPTPDAGDDGAGSDSPGDKPGDEPADGDAPSDPDAPGEPDEPAPDDPDAPEPPAEGDVVDVKVVSGALKFTPATLEVEAGKVTFRFTNPDDIGHDFTIFDSNDEKVGGTSLISEGSEDLEVELAPGTYRFVCTPHEGAGMVGTLVVS